MGYAVLSPKRMVVVEPVCELEELESEELEELWELEELELLERLEELLEALVELELEELDELDELLECELELLESELLDELLEELEEDSIAGGSGRYPIAIICAKYVGPLGALIGALSHTQSPRER